MQVFKLFFKIIRKNLPLLTIYIVVFVSISAIFAQSGQTEAITEFTESRASVAFVNRDSGSVLIDGLIGYMAEKSDLVDLPDDAEAIQDALLTRQSIPNSTAGIYAEMLINNYLNTAARYVKYAGGISQEKIDGIRGGRSVAGDGRLCQKLRKRRHRRRKSCTHLQFLGLPADHHPHTRNQHIYDRIQRHCEKTAHALFACLPAENRT